MNSKTRLLLIGLLFLFVLVRLPGLSTPYQQDEFKTAIAAEASLSAASAFLSHPPLTALLMRADALAFGGTHLRIMPLLFGLVSAILLFLVVRRRFSEEAALWSLFLYTISFYGVWASLMLDTDGAILPTFLLAAVYCYDRAKVEGRQWTGLLAITLVAGLLVKLSFVLVIAALAVDFLFEKRKDLTLVRVGYMAGAALGFGALVVGSFALIKFMNPAFDVHGMVSHALYYAHWSGRSYLQVVIQSVKAVFYLSPLLLAPLLFISRDIVKRATPLLWYLGFGFVFYFILFDFSHGALDKYLMFTIIPLCVISGAVLSRLLDSFSFQEHPRTSLMGLVILVALIALMFVPQQVVPLYPKTEWFSRVIYGDWKILTAFNGGSGPVGFYMSFLVIASSFVVAGIAALVGRIWKSLLGIAAAVIIVCVGMAYNAAFIEEFSFGKVYGNVAVVLNSTITYLKTNDIKRVNTHNDIGAYQLKQIGKYDGSHFTAAPQFEVAARSYLPAFEGVFLVIDVPPLYDGFYRDFFKSCKVLFSTQSGIITGTVYSACTWTKE